MSERERTAGAGSVHRSDSSTRAASESVAWKKPNPLEQIACRVGEACSVAAHAAALKRAPSRDSLVHLQRQHGNRFVQRVVEMARIGQAAPEIERDIERQRGQGQPLGSEVRRVMEPALGADLEAVRIHTDAESDALSRSLEARAFTTGRDIFFRQGEYDPGNSSGRELLAHELTHVLQQAGAIRPKLTVSEPGEKEEEEADQVARAVVSGLARSPAQRLSTDAARKIRRRAEVIRAPWWGSAPSGTSDSNVWFNPHAELWVGGSRTQDNWFPSGSVAQFTVPPGTSGTIRLQVDTGWFQDNVVFNYSGNGWTTVEIDFTTTADGTVQWGAPVLAGSTGGDAAELVLPVLTSARASDTGGQIMATAVIRSQGASVATATPSVAPGGIGGSMGAQESTPRIGAWQRSYIVNLVVPRPRRQQLQHVWTTTVHFAPGSDRLLSETDAFIGGWFLGLPQAVRDTVRAGTTPITLRGHASTTRSADYNRRLSRRRCERVREILRDYAGTTARIEFTATGELEARTADEVEDENERRVEIDVTAIETVTTP